MAQAAQNRVGLVGYGAIGSQLVQSLTDLENELENKIELVGVFDPYVEVAPSKVSTLQDLCELKPDLIVEAAGHAGLKECIKPILSSGIDLFIVSVGALGDDILLSELKELASQKGNGRFIISTGAIGGVDIFNAVKLAGKIETAEVISTKPAKNLLVPELDTQTKTALLQAKEPVVAYSGKVREALKLFPQSANVCATFGFATLGLDETKATLIGDPNQIQITHQLKVVGEAGSYEFTFSNKPSAKNPKTSAVVPYAVLRAIKTWSEFRSGFRNQSDYLFL